MTGLCGCVVYISVVLIALVDKSTLYLDDDGDVNVPRRKQRSGLFNRLFICVVKVWMWFWMCMCM